jgi:hypothetical protein
MAGFNIKDFASHMNANGLMRNNKFLVRMPYPQGFDNVPALKESSRYVELWCDSTAIPGVNIKTAETRRYGYGPVEKFGSVASFNGVTLTFIADKNAKVHYFFHNWTKLISNYDVRTGDFSRQSGIGSQRPYEISYKNTYVSNVEIIVFDDNGKQTMKVVLRHAYPTAIGDIQLNWSDTNDFVKIPVSFTFTDFYIEYYTL